MRIFAALAVLTACGSADTPAPARHDIALPSSRAELVVLLATADLPTRTAAKGAIRHLDGDGRIRFDRVAIVGASMSAGFGGLPFERAFDAAIHADHDILAPATTFFFRSPQATGRDHVDQAIAHDATVVVAVDILFWYAYVHGSLDARMANLERGLANLERVTAPLVVGDLPDMRTGEPWMLPPSVVPPPDQLAALNARIHDWARGRLNVHLVPLAAWSAPLTTGGNVVVDPGEPPVDATTLLNVDGLHPNPRGVTYLLRNLDATLEIGFPDTPRRALAF